MFTGPVGPVEVFFYWPEAVFGNFYWPGDIGSPLASSPAATSHHSFYYFLLKLTTSSIRVNIYLSGQSIVWKLYEREMSKRHTKMLSFTCFVNSCILN